MVVAGGLLLFDDGGAMPFALSFAGALVFSGLGGLEPASLFALAVRAAPHPRTVSTTVGWMMQGSALGQFVGPPAVAAVATLAGGWHWSPAVTDAAALLGLALVGPLGRAVAGPGLGAPTGQALSAARYTGSSSRPRGSVHAACAPSAVIVNWSSMMKPPSPST